MVGKKLSFDHRLYVKVYGRIFAFE